MQVIQSNPSWQLGASVTPTPFGYHLILSSFVPTARRPEHRVKFSGTFSTSELQKLLTTISFALDGQAMEAPHHG